MSDDTNPQSEGASVVTLPVPPAWNGAAMTTIRVPVALVDMLKSMKPGIEPPMVITLLVEEALAWAAQHQKHSVAIQENALLKQKLAETIVQLWEEQRKTQEARA